MCTPGTKADSVTFTLTSWDRSQRIKDNTPSPGFRRSQQNWWQREWQIKKVCNLLLRLEKSEGCGGMTQEDKSVQDERARNRGRLEVKSWNTILKIYQVLSAQNKPITFLRFSVLSLRASSASSCCCSQPPCERKVTTVTPLLEFYVKRFLLRNC